VAAPRGPRRLAARGDLYRAAIEHANALHDGLLSIDTPEDELDLALEWAKVNLDEAMVCNPDIGCGLVAGYGLSGAASDRPGFGWFFGGDAAWNALSLDALGAFDVTKAVGVTIAIAVLAGLWVVHALWVARHSEGRNPALIRDRERRGF
jgi:glycogen debranching enzyme